MTDVISTAIDAAFRELNEGAAEPAALLPDGVYLNLPDTVYHADPALGSTDLKAILTNPVQWHARERNPDRDLYYPPKEEDTAAKRFGRALHKIVLEGAEAFDAAYFVAPEEPDGLLDGKDELFAFINERVAPAKVGEPRWFSGLPDALIENLIGAKGQALKSARKESLIAAARHLGCASLKVDWEALVTIQAGGREMISAEWWRRLHMIRRVVDAHSRAGMFLRHGRPEVSVFWTDEDGTRFKCRFDYLRTRVVTDLKTYACREGLEPVQTFVYALESLAYDLSKEHYMRARRDVFPRLVASGAVFDWNRLATEGGLSMGDPCGVPNDADRAFLMRCANEPAPSWAWVACMTMGFPEVDAIELPAGLMIELAAATQLDEAISKYKDFRQRFGPDDRVPWVSDRGIVQLSEAMFGRKAVNRGQAMWESRQD